MEAIKAIKVIKIKYTIEITFADLLYFSLCSSIDNKRNILVDLVFN